MTLLKQILSATTLVLLSAASIAGTQPTELLGNWRSLDANNGALAGTINFKADSITLKAEGNEPLVGTWEEASPGSLVFTVPNVGSTTVGYGLKKAVLTLTYDNGNKQTFKREKSKAKSKVNASK